VTTNLSQAVSTSTPQHVQHTTSQDGALSGANTSKNNFRQLAVDIHQGEGSSIANQMVEVEQVASASAAGNADFAAQLLHTTQQSQQEFKFKQDLRSLRYGEIYLLSLEQGYTSKDLRYALKRVKLAQPPVYYAVSYCWGAAVSDSTLKTITVNGALKKVRPTL
jgi:hypothetical protein